jgi:hypothetical protein
MERCLMRRKEHEEDPKSSRHAHDVPSLVMLSGT